MAAVYEDLIELGLVRSDDIWALYLLGNMSKEEIKKRFGVEIDWEK